MLLPRSNKKNRRTNPNGSAKLAYQNLEDRRLLATVVAFDTLTNDLSITLTESNDIATVDVASNGNVTVNGNEDIGSLVGLQTAGISDVRSITVQGVDLLTNQQVVFNGDFTQANGAFLQTITVDDVSHVTFNGSYDTTGDLNIVLSGIGGEISDGTTGRLNIRGATNLHVGSNPIVLDNLPNDFNGLFNISNTGDNDVSISDANNIRLATAAITGDLTLVAGNDITDVAGSTIEVGGFTKFTAANVRLGDQSPDIVNFMAISSTTSGDLNISEDSLVILLNINADNLRVSSPVAIFDGRRTTIDVAQNATFIGENQIRIGENGTDRFMAGSVSFRSNGHVHLYEDDSTVITGINTAASLSMFSESSITDTESAQTNIVGKTQFEGADIVLGDSAVDQFNSGSIHFVTWGDMNVKENSDMHIIETKNTARRMFLEADGAITDASDARINIERFAGFTAEFVNIGDTEDDRFNAGSIRFSTTGRFELNEDSATNIVGTNNAFGSTINSTDEVTNNFVSGDGLGTVIDVTSVASFSGTEIDLGNQSNDSINFGSLRVNSTGAASISEDSSTHLTLSSQVDELNLVSAGAITDAISASMDVTGIANIQGTSIRIGETATDQFNAQSVTLNSIGAVELTEDSRLNLTGISSADSMVLNANGSVTDSLNSQTRVTNLFSGSGTLINLGTSSTEVFEMGQFSFNSTLNTFVVADTSFEIMGNNRSGDRLILRSPGDITDAADAETRVQNLVDISAVDVIIGELATDCFDIVNGGASRLFVNATGTRNTQLGGC